jgi:hypothetical protein
MYSWLLPQKYSNSQKVTKHAGNAAKMLTKISVLFKITKMSTKAGSLKCMVLATLVLRGGET